MLHRFRQLAGAQLVAITVEIVGRQQQVAELILAREIRHGAQQFLDARVVVVIVELGRNRADCRTCGRCRDTAADPRRRTRWHRGGTLLSDPLVGRPAAFKIGRGSSRTDPARNATGRRSGEENRKAPSAASDPQPGEAAKRSADAVSSRLAQRLRRCCASSVQRPANKSG